MVDQGRREEEVLRRKGRERKELRGVGVVERTEKPDTVRKGRLGRKRRTFSLEFMPAHARAWCLRASACECV